MAGRGTTTPEYQLFQTHYSALSSGIADAVETVAEKALEKKLISPQNVAKALNKTSTKFERSSELTLQLHSRVGQRTKDFYVIVEILKSIPTLDHLAELLAPGQASTQQAAAEQGSGKASPKSGKALDQANGAGQPSKLKEKPSIKEFYLALLPIADVWKDIGVLLDLPSGTLASLQSENHRDRDRMREMGVEWLKTLNANWGALIEAVKEVNEARALEIEKRWCS